MVVWKLADFEILWVEHWKVSCFLEKHVLLSDSLKYIPA